MAKLQDKFFNRVIEGDLELGQVEKKSIVEGASGVKILENIEDVQGHKRFIEGIIDCAEEEGVTYPYAKWSLSGSHLMIVLCKQMANGTTLASGFNAIINNLPDWLASKIVPLVPSGLLENKTFTGWNDNTTTNQAFAFSLYKDENKLKLYNSSATTTDKRTVRAVFDLLIDNASE